MDADTLQNVTQLFHSAAQHWNISATNNKKQNKKYFKKASLYVVFINYTEVRTKEILIR